ncbi:MAG: Co2+/Mg2+ efflux protein ApaG [Candidatus Delongbacteria bacterium]
MPSNTASERVTRQIRVVAEPQYLPHYSEPENDHYVYSYRIRIRNESPRTVMVAARHWLIIDTDGNRDVVDGLGVVGEQPVLEPGMDFEYSSFCPLSCTFGTMEGWYEVVGEEGERFQVEIGRFYLVARPDEELEQVS